MADAPSASGGSDGSFARLRAFHDDHPVWTWLLVFGLPLAVVAAGSVVAPSVFWDHFVWEDIVGPLWSDAHQCSRTTTCHVDPPNDVPAKEGYTITSEITYGLILAAALYAIYTNLFVRLGVTADAGYVLALSPLILLGPTGRVLEDANAFIGAGGLPAPIAYGFISPVIYIHIAVYAVAFTLLGVLVHRANDAGTEPWRLTGLVGALLAAEVALYAVLATGYANAFGALAPVWVPGLAALVALAGFHSRATARRVGVNATVFALGLPLAAIPLFLIGRWVTGGIWSEAAWNGEIYSTAGAVIMLLALAVTLVVGLIGLLGARAARGTSGTVLASYAGGLNLAMVFGHMLDGFATWIALMDPFHMGLPRYGEKHPVSDVLLQLGGGTPFHGLAFPLTKLAMILGVIALVDHEMRRSTATEKNLLGLIKLAILVLGLAPGTRDLLRIMMGV